jgi:hypothetical protein
MESENKRVEIEIFKAAFVRKSTKSLKIIHQGEEL